jgi:hypothetical protein
LHAPATSGEIASVLENIRPMIGTAPLAQAADAYARMMESKARFRTVLVTTDGSLAVYGLRHDWKYHLKKRR